MEPNHIQNKQDLKDAIDRVIADLLQFTLDDDYELSLNKYNRNHIESILNNTDIKNAVCDVVKNPIELFERHTIEKNKTQLSANGTTIHQKPTLLTFLSVDVTKIYIFTQERIFVE